ncbi:MAG: hypothetical protein JNL39_04640 [Opitutaceae bacterium]|nr:hypothetical protein [Opitutaceae bacterium]
MSTPTEIKRQLAAFPAALQKLVAAELKAGNTIAELSHGFPAAPCGAYVKLAQPVGPRRRKSAGEITFFDRNGSDYAGEFTTAQRHFFVLEPARPPEPAPDMDALRAAREASQRAADEKLYRAQARDKKKRAQPYVPATPSPLPPRPEAAAKSIRPATAVDRFRESMVVTYERWHEGIGYDLALLKTATPDELLEIEELLLPRATDGWREVEALAAIDSPRARVALRQALKRGNHEVRTAVLRHAPRLVSDAERTAALVAALEGSDTYGGLTQALAQVEEFHPPAIVDALLRGVLTRTDGPPVHFAAMLMFIHGKAKSAFDWDRRPFFLEFNTDDGEKRRALFRDLCSKIGVDPAPYLATSD